MKGVIFRPVRAPARGGGFPGADAPGKQNPRRPFGPEKRLRRFTIAPRGVTQRRPGLNQAEEPSQLIGGLFFAILRNRGMVAVWTR